MKRSEKELVMSRAKKMCLEELRLILSVRRKDIVIVSNMHNGNTAIQLDHMGPTASYNEGFIQITTEDAQKRFDDAESAFESMKYPGIEEDSNG